MEQLPQRSCRSVHPPSGQDRFDALFAAHANGILAYFLRRVKPRDDAADLLAEVFVVAWRRLGDVPAEPEARLWLFGVARRVLASHRRGQRRYDALTARLRSEVAVACLAVDSPMSSPVSIPAIAEALSALSPRAREILLLVGWDGLSPAEAAVVLEIDPGTARVRLHRARTQFAEALQPKQTMKRNDRSGHTNSDGREPSAVDERR